MEKMVDWSRRRRDVLRTWGFDLSRLSGNPPPGKVKIIPNPTDNFFVIDWDIKPANYNLEIYDGSGKLIFKGKNVTKHDLSKEKNGLYFIHIRSDDFEITEKIVKI